jgi:hypothetical protein
VSIDVNSLTPGEVVEALTRELSAC